MSEKPVAAFLLLQTQTRTYVHFACTFIYICGIMSEGEGEKVQFVHGERRMSQIDNKIKINITNIKEV